MFWRSFALSALPFAAAFGQVLVIGHPPAGVVRPAPIFDDCRIESVEIRAVVVDQASKVRVSQTFQNPSPVAMQAQVLFPLPADAAVSGLTLLVDGKEITGKLMGRDEARRTYEEIVRRRRDPALLEYMGGNLFQTSVFPVAPGGRSTVELRYSELLKKDSGLIDFGLPLGVAKHSAKPVERLSVTVNLTAPAPIRTVYSPTHKVDIRRPDVSHAEVKLNLTNLANPDNFRLLYSTDAGPVGLNVLSYKPEENEDGYFALLATPDTGANRAAKLPKTVVLVCDRSGSMAGPKIAQVKSALSYILRQLDPADTFNLIAYDSEVESFRPELQRADAASIDAALAWVGGIEAGGATNIDGALRAGLGMLTDASRPNYLLFLTDGAPTAGETRETQIAANAVSENKVNARLFAFGVGYDVNARLLDRLARELRGASIYVRPNEDIEAPVSALYGKIGSPMMTGVAVNIGLDGGAVSHIYPRQMPDLFRGDQLVLVGRYRKGGEAKITVAGDAAGRKSAFDYTAKFAERSLDDTNGFVARLWATRRIGDIIDDLDLHGNNQELVDELVRLSEKYGILTPYTSFLTEDGVDLLQVRAVAGLAGGNVSRRMTQVTGQDAVLQRQLKAQYQAANNLQQSFVIAPATPGPTTAQAKMRQIGQKVFFEKAGVWQDSSVTASDEQSAIRVVRFSQEYFDLAESHNGALAAYLAQDGPVLVKLGAQTYRIEP